MVDLIFIKVVIFYLIYIFILMFVINNRYMYNNPFHSKKERYKFNGYYYATKIKKLDHDKAIEYAELDNTYSRKKYLNEQPGTRPANNLKHLTYKDLPYPTYDKEGIIKEDDNYVYYKDKIWSKTYDKYLANYYTSKSTYILYRDPIDNKFKRYIIEERKRKPRANNKNLYVEVI